MNLKVTEDELKEDTGTQLAFLAHEIAKTFGWKVISISVKTTQGTVTLEPYN